MKREDHHFPSPRRERITQADLSDDFLMSIPFMELDQSSVPAPVFYRRSLPKRVKSEGRPQERQPLIIERESEVYEPEPVVPPEIVKEEVKEQKPVAEKPKPESRLAVKKRDVKVRDIRPLTRLVEMRKEEPPLEIPTSYDRISVVMAFRGSNEGRLDGLTKCIKCLREQTIDCYIILVEQDSVPVHQEILEPLVDSYLFTYSKAMFNKSWAFNCGAMIAPDDLILFHDCDLLMPKTYVRESMKILGTKDMALPWAKILYLTEESSKNYPGLNPKVSYTTTSHQAVGGSLLIRKNFYLKIGGMDERFYGWGGEDNAFYAKAVKLGRVSKSSPVNGMTLIHHFHKIAPRTHSHNHVNNHVLWQYYQGSDRDILVRIRILDPIGDPLKEKNKEESIPEDGDVRAARVVRMK